MAFLRHIFTVTQIQIWGGLVGDITFYVEKHALYLLLNLKFEKYALNLFARNRYV